MTVAEALKRFRKTFHLTQKDVAEKLGITQQSYQVYEGKSVPTATVLIKLADAYDVSVDYLIGRSDMPKPTNFDEKEVREAFAFRDAWQKAIQSLPMVPATGQVPAQ